MFVDWAVFVQTAKNMNTGESIITPEMLIINLAENIIYEDQMCISSKVVLCGGIFHLYMNFHISLSTLPILI